MFLVLTAAAARIVAGEDASYALLGQQHCGLSFRLPVGPGMAAHVPDSARVNMVLVTGCQ